MVSLSPSRPTHLSIFVSDIATGQPLARLPLYAEIAVPRIAPPPPTEERINEPIAAAIIHVDPDATGATRKRAIAAAQQAVGEALAPESIDALADDPDRTRDLFVRVFEDALRAARQDHVADIKPSALEPLIVDALKRHAGEFGLTLLQPPEDTGIVWAEPLGVLTTDHVGYASYDLTRIRPDIYDSLAAAIEARREDPDAVPALAIWIYPYGHPGRFDALAQGRFALDAIAARITVEGSPLPPALKNMGPQALQNPSLTDWRLSPASFAASPKALVGESGCEELVPSNLALQQFVLRQVVRLVDAPVGMNMPAPYKPGYVDEYKVSWFSLGHSLGEILYSLPLAPAESVRLAVIDWSWDSLATRDEKTTLTENLVHQTHRDRSITETVKAGIKETQHGSSFMGGVATSAGASGTLGEIGVAIGNAWSLGGSTATSDGSRDLAAENVQRLSDGFSQASSSQREINSTVVVQAREEEKESIQTRTFTNYNHAHTLTILYYEVLRHYRVTVEWMRRRQIALVPRPPRTWTPALARTYRAILEPAVFDPKAKAGFDAIEHLLQAETDDAVNPKPAPPPIAQERDRQITSFIFTIEVGEEETTSGVHIEARLTSNALVPLLLDGNANINKDELFNNDGTYPIPLTPQTPIRWGDLVGIDLYVSGTDNLDLPQIGIVGLGAFPQINLRDFGGPQLSFVDEDKRQTITVRQPGPDIAPPPPPPTGKQRISPEDNAAITRLIEHLQAFSDFYERVIYLTRDQDSLAQLLAGMAWTPGSTALDNLDPAALETFGGYVAFALARQSKLDDETAAALAASKSERLISLPTRGIFAEGKLGHCNVAEEINDTRFWKWEEHPIPIEAPGINPVTPVQPQPQQVDTSPTPFPQSLVNIVNPTAAPDPTGLAAALTAIATPNIFRDMSGRAEVADLLKRLSDNSIKIAEASSKARGILANQAAGAGAGGSGSGTASGGGTGTGTAGAGAKSGSAPMAPDEQLQRMQVVRSAVDKDELSAEAGKQKIGQIIDAGTPKPDQSASRIDLSDNSPEVRAFNPPADKSGRAVLGASIGGELPAGVKFEWHENRNLVEFNQPAGAPGFMTEATAIKPGQTEVAFRILDNNDQQIDSATLLLSVPQFIEILGASDLDTSFATWHLSGRKADILEGAQQVADELMAIANVRMVWSVAPLSESLPAQFQTGGKGRENLSRLTLADKSATGQFADYGGTDPAILTFGEAVQLNLSLLSSEHVVVPFMQSIVTKLGSLAAPDPALEDFAVKLISRFLGNCVALAVRHLVFGFNISGPVSGAKVTFVEETGFTVQEGGDVTDPSTYADVGVGPMHFATQTQQLSNLYFPVPPAFK